MNEPRVNGLCDAVTATAQHNFTVPKNKSSDESVSEIDYSLEIVNCVPVLELAKSNIVALIDDHIALIREKGQSIQSQQNERIKQIKLERAQKSIERRNHIQRIRDEFDSTINRFKYLLDDLEKI